MIERVAQDDGDIELRFVLPKHHPALPIGVAGDFNEWDWNRTPLEPKGEHLEARIKVARGRKYEFRYRGGDQTWFNDDQADDYVPNEFGGVNCLIDLSAN